MDVIEQLSTEPPLADLLSLRGKAVVVTGGARGIGEATAHRMAEAGAHVVVVDVDADAADQVARDVRRRFHGHALGRAADVTNSARLREIAEETRDRFGTLGVWVNNAGIYPTTGEVTEADDDHLDMMLAVNVRGSFAGAREAARVMEGAGVIVNLSSMTAMTPMPGITGYATSKAAIIALTKSLAREFQDRGIRVLAVAPGLVTTPGVEAQRAQLLAAGVQVGAKGASVISRPDHLARMILALSSPLGEMVNGTTVLVDGGRLTMG